MSLGTTRPRVDGPESPPRPTGSASARCPTDAAPGAAPCSSPWPRPWWPRWSGWSAGAPGSASTGSRSPGSPARRRRPSTAWSRFPWALRWPGSTPRSSGPGCASGSPSPRCRCAARGRARSPSRWCRAAPRSWCETLRVDWRSWIPRGSPSAPCAPPQGRAGGHRDRCRGHHPGGAACRRWRCSRHCPPSWPRSVSGIRVSSANLVTFTLGPRTVVWGGGEDSARKVAILTALLRTKAKVIDVSAPDTPVTR